MFNAAYVGHGLTPTSVVAEARSADSKVLLALIADKTMVATFAGAAMMPNALHCYSIFPHRRSKGSKRDTVWFSHKESDRERENLGTHLYAYYVIVTGDYQRQLYLFAYL